MTKKSPGRPSIKLKAGVIARRNGRVLLIRELNNRTHKYAWNIIKGTFETKKDASIEETAHREAMEEAGIRIKLRYLLGSYFLQDRGDSLMMFVFVSDMLDQPAVSKLKTNKKYRKGENIIEARMFSRRELAKLKPKDFIGLRGYLAVQDYLRGKRVSLEFLKTLEPK